MSSMDIESLVPRDVQAMLQMQQKAFEGFMRTYMDSVNNRIDGIFGQLGELRGTLTSVQKDVAALVDKDKDRSKEAVDLQERLDQIESHADYLENQSRRNNLRIDGIFENPKETWEVTESKVRETLVSALGFNTTEANDVPIERAHRTGKPRALPTTSDASGSNIPPSTARPVVVKFGTYKAREAILRRAKDRKPLGIFIYEDLSARVLETRKNQLEELKRQRDLGRIAYFSYDKLIVRDKPVSSTSR